MPARKDRTPVVLDTNVVIGYYLSRNPSSANSQVYRLWRDQRTLQLIVSDPVTEEYLEVLLSLGVEDHRVRRLADRLNRRRTVTHVNLGPAFAKAAIPTTTSFWQPLTPVEWNTLSPMTVICWTSRPRSGANSVLKS